jgi:hypothetical protein
MHFRFPAEPELDDTASTDLGAAVQSTHTVACGQEQGDIYYKKENFLQ